MVAREDAAHEIAVDRTAIARPVLGQTLAPLLERGAAFAGPHQRIERYALHALGMALREKPRPQRTRRGTVKKDLRGIRILRDELCRGSHVVSAARDIRVDGPPFVRTAVTFAVDAPGVVAQTGEPVHR